MTTAPRPTGEYLSARETIALLDIKLQTLYAYVSRGLIRSASRPGRKERMYLRADVERVQARALARAGHSAVAADAMNFGQAIIPTAITEITPQGPRYRGQLALDLARAGTPFEAVAQLLWTGAMQPDAPAWPQAPAPADVVALADSLRTSAARHPLLEVLALVTLHLGLRRRPMGRRAGEEAMVDEARQILAVLVGCCGLATKANRYVPMARGERIADGLLRALGGKPRPEHAAAVAAMLALLADHELSPGTLAVRVAASGGATLHACIAAGVSSSSGINVAQVFDDIHDFLAAARTSDVLVSRAMERHAQGRPIPGFGHALYPQGDPRATMLIAFIRERMPTRGLLAVCDFIEEVQRATGLLVRHELPMVALTRAMGLPRQAASAIFLVSRTAGWVAHIQEQRESGQLMRPRARFVGSANPAEDALKNQS
ncbi:MAG TPA: citrate synthase [Ramlibacter sp.]|jgi:citrate synthase|nr:citrate synthase [Ramlibacter sp.]